MDITTDKKINDLISIPKQILEKETSKQKYKHKRRNIKLKDNNGNEYQIYLRQNVNHKTCFSCELSIKKRDGNFFILMRCNGNMHSHTNKLEKK